MVVVGDSNAFHVGLYTDFESTFYKSSYNIICQNYKRNTRRDKKRSY